MQMKPGKYSLVIFFFFTAAVGYCQPGNGGVLSGDWLNAITANAVQKPMKPGLFAPARTGFALYYSKSGNIDQPYLVYVPKGYDPAGKAPVVVFLHGAILARDSFRYRDPAIADEPVFSIGDVYKTLVVFPFGRRGFMWPGTVAANENIIAILEQVKKLYHVDERQVYIGGISMGGIATYWFMKNKTEYFSGFYTFSSTPSLSSEAGVLEAISPVKPLYSMNAKDDAVFTFEVAARDYESQKHAVKGWYFSSVPTGGHRFIYGKEGVGYIQRLLGHLLTKQ
jgi:predicted peptidase